jgi:uncharacterized membrane protein (UPF0127 family)
LGSILFSISSCKEEQKAIKPITIEFKKEGKLTIYKSTSDSLIAQFEIEIADNDYEVQTGLMHRKSMENERARLFIFPDNRMLSFYMKNTYISLDIIYIDNNKHIVSIQENSNPMDETPLHSQFPAQYVLEINAGLSKELNLKVGDSIEFTKD